MTDHKVYWLWLTQIKGIGPKLSKRLLDAFGDPKAIHEAAEKELLKVPGIGPKLADHITDSTPLEQAKRALERLIRNKVKILTLYDDLYPPSLKVQPDAPTVLYYQGEIRCDEKGVAIIGSRRCTSYAKQVTRELATYLALNNISIIGGLSKGVEGYAHTACLHAGGYTVAFLAHGLDQCYPREHHELLEAIKERGVVISQFPLGTSPHPTNFPKRNRLACAWSKTIIVVEADQHSPALATAQYANELGRVVYAVPNNIFNKDSEGTNRLIQKGAKIYLEPSQLLGNDPSLFQEAAKKKALSLPGKAQSNGSLQANCFSLEAQILNLLGDTQLNLANLSHSLGVNQKEFFEAISTLHIEGKIVMLPGGLISRGDRR